MLTLKECLNRCRFSIFEEFRNRFLMNIIMLAHTLFRDSTVITFRKSALKSVFDYLQFWYPFIRKNDLLKLAQVKCCHVICNFVPDFHRNRMILFDCVIVFVMPKRISRWYTDFTEPADHHSKGRKMSNVRFYVLI